MITARYEPHVFSKERSPSPHLGLRGCTPPPSSNSDGGDDIDRFMELAHAALEEATKEEDAKGVLQELVERVLARTGAPLMAGIITEQLRSQEVIEQLAERSFEQQARRRQHRLLNQGSTVLSARPKKHQLNSVSTLPTALSSSTAHRPSSSPLQRTKPLSSSPSIVSSASTTTVSLSSAPSSSLSISSSISAPPSLSAAPPSKGPHDPTALDEEAVTRDQFIIQQASPLHTQPDRLLLVSEYIWRLFRLLILACLVALVYHYVCSYPQQWFV
ncbi:hypothetical protein [Absidia glauca]|uniref:Uncharacterized protein n=1 Tax=Absidia glauca TaxID=4829 RepID=A0A163IRZ1_ABSGL|nr:hypothetical protein [Absidia glauca]